MFYNSGEIAAIVCLNSILEIGGTKQVPRLQQLPDICSDQTENRRWDISLFDKTSCKQLNIFVSSVCRILKMNTVENFFLHSTLFWLLIKFCWITFYCVHSVCFLFHSVIWKTYALFICSLWLFNWKHIVFDKMIKVPQGGRW